MIHTFRDSPQPPYYAVIFCSELTGNDLEHYRSLGDEMLVLAQQQPGYLGYEDLSSSSTHGLNVSYWTDLEAIRNWRNDAEHKLAQCQGREKWYQWFECRIARVERAYSFDRPDTGEPA